MFNHSEDPNAAFGSRFEVVTRAKGAGAVPSKALLEAPDLDQWFVVALRDIPPSAQIFLQYCDETDQVDLFLNHGIPTTDGAAIVPLPSHAYVADLVNLPLVDSNALLPGLIAEEREHRVVFICGNDVERAFDAYRLMLAASCCSTNESKMAVFAAVQAKEQTLSDVAAAKLLLAVCTKLLDEGELPDDAMRHTQTIRRLQTSIRAAHPSIL
jgi:hypothetical protein